ncbi:hypothetical protein PRZ48_000488 [Zasmidium cellare]|uniref:Sulfotransferase domain-containing protein n=1 Tax=Zasmidium cellare TaxID=395010 RepID=A0ABR0EZX5_ZASCE|nr:hypothetical protein PRZ48_000488 [Zasmidium cellare]
MAPTNDRKNVLLLTSARTRSNLVFRWICTSPDVHPIQYPFAPTTRYGKPENCLLHHMRHSEERRQELVQWHDGQDTPQDSVALVEKNLRAADEEGKVGVVIDQWDHLVRVPEGLEILRQEEVVLPQNPTWLPDEMLTSTTTIILIRHPAAVVDSIYRLLFAVARKYGLDDEDFHLVSTARAHRLLFDLFTSRGLKPIVLDSWDVVTNPARIQGVLEEKLGIRGMSDVWKPKTEEELARMHPRTLGATRVANESSGIQRVESDKASEMEGKDFFVQWKEKYGERVAKQLQAYVDLNLPHYEYLRKFKV